MHAGRLKYTILGLLVYMQSAFSGGSKTCDSEFGDLASRTLQSSIVFQGTMLGRSTIVSGRYNGTFDVIKVLKGSLPMKSISEYMPVITGDFAVKEDIEACLPNARLGQTYILFLSPQKMPGIPFYPLKGFPEQPIRKVSRIIKETVECGERYTDGFPSCLKKPEARASKTEVRARGGSNIDLRCKTEGYPLPVVDWVKDQKSLRGAAAIDIHTNKRGSRLRIENIRQEDHGTYYCVAKNFLGNDAAKIELHVIGGEIAKPHEEMCKEQTYCLNGGTCYYLRNLGTKFCKCLEGYTGRRCLMKEPLVVTDPKVAHDRSRNELKFDRTMTISGIIIGALVLVAMCIAAYCMAKNKRKQFFKKKARREKLQKLQQQAEPEKQPLKQQPNGMIVNMTNPSGVILRTRADSTRSFKSTTTQTSPEPAMRWQSQPIGVGGRTSPPPQYNSCQRSRSGSDHSGHSIGYNQRDSRRRLPGLSSSVEVIDDRFKAHPNFIVNAVVESDQEASKRSSPSHSSKTESTHGHMGMELSSLPTWRGSVGSLEEDDQPSDYENPTSDADLASDGPSQQPVGGSGSQESHHREMEVSSSSEGSDTEDSSSGPGEEHALFERLKSNPPINNPKRQSPSWHLHENHLDDFVPNHYMFNPYAREQAIIPSKYMQNPRHTDNQNDHYNYIYSPEDYADGPVQLIDPDPDATVV